MTDPLNIELDLRQSHDQSIGVSLTWTPVSQRQILQFPLWTPGSYTVRDPAQYLHGLDLQSKAGSISLRRLAPNRWVADLPDLSPLQLSYWLEARNLTVRTAHLDPDFASISPAAVVMEVDGFRWLPHFLTVKAPDLVCALPPSRPRPWVGRIGFRCIDRQPDSWGRVRVRTFFGDGASARTAAHRFPSPWMAPGFCSRR